VPVKSARILHAHGPKQAKEYQSNLKAGFHLPPRFRSIYNVPANKHP
jgi:hypothetical protein